MSGLPAIHPGHMPGREIATSRPTRSESHSGGWYDALSARAIVFPTVVFVVHFAIVQFVAMMALRFGTQSTTYESVRARQGFISTLEGSWIRIVAPFIQWDSYWFSYSARSGFRDGALDQMDRFGSTADTFWPLLPWLIRSLSVATNLSPEITGFFLVNCCFAGALIVLYHLILEEFSVGIARRALWCLVLFPTSFFFHAVYTEAPFLLLVVAALLAARKNRWFLAGVIALMAALMRSHGVLLILPMLVIFFDAMRRDRRRWLPGLALILLPLFGPLIYGWKWHQAGYSWRSMMHLQQRMLEYGKSPWQSIPCAIRSCTTDVTLHQSWIRAALPEASWRWFMQLIEHPSWQLIASSGWRRQAAVSTSLDVVVALGCLLLVIVGLTKLPLWMNVYLLSLLVVALIRTPIDNPFAGMARFALLLFPLAIVLALLLEDRIVRILAASTGLLLLIALTIQFANSYWVS
jgi:hypothetical protein